MGDPMSDVAVKLPPGLQGRYRVEREVGRGGMGAVFLAVDLRLDRPVALKVLPPEFATDVALRERFLRETRTAASFSHPNIVPVHSVEEDAGSLAFVMGFVEGESLAARVARTGPLDVRSVVRLLQDVAYALAYAHGRGVVHRDIKPDNIMIERATGRALVMDFGISRSIVQPAEAQGLTRIGEIVGTPEYMSPEQASADHVDGRSDLYALGLVALFALTGRAPIGGGSTQQLIVRQLTEVLPPAASLRPDLPPALADAIDRCVAKAPDERFATAEALVEAIDSAQLAAPEIPLPIRLFAQEAARLGLVLSFFAVISWVIVATLSRLTGGIDAWLPVMLLMGVVLTRVLQARSEAGRLAAAGFTVDHVMAGMRAVVEERATVRAAVGTSAAVRKRRRRTVTIALLQLPVAALFAKLALDSREQVGPSSYRVGFGATTLVVTALILTGVSFVLLIRSPFRAPIGERLFRLVWLGPFGRAFVRGAMRQAGKAAGSPESSATAVRVPAAPMVARTPAPTPGTVAVTVTGHLVPVAPGDGTDVRLDRIEARLAAIERAVTRPGRG